MPKKQVYLQMAGQSEATAKPIEVPGHFTVENFKKKVAGVRLFDDFEADWTKILYFTLDKEPTRYGATADDEKCADLGFFDAETVWIWVAASAEFITKHEKIEKEEAEKAAAYKHKHAVEYGAKQEVAEALKDEEPEEVAAESEPAATFVPAAKPAAAAAKFCGECGAKNTGSKFCSECGTKL